MSGTEDTGAVSEDDLRDSVNSMEENEIGQTYTVDAGQNVLYDGEYAATMKWMNRVSMASTSARSAMARFRSL